MSLYNAEPIRTEPFRLTVSQWSDRSGPTVCESCGCRLESVAARAGGHGTRRHFAGAFCRDARGCRVDCVDLDHGSDGTPLT